MKQVSDALNDLLNNSRVFFMCDLYEIALQSGLIFRFAAYDMDLVVDGHVFSSRGPIFKRNQIKISSDLSVDSLTVTVSAEKGDTIGGTPILQIARNGGFDEAQVSLYRCFMSTPGVVVGTMLMFLGEADVTDGGGIKMTWKVQSSLKRLNVKFPIRNYYPSCPYIIFDAGCGLNIADWEAAGTVTTVSSAQKISISNSFAAGYFDNGEIEFLSGELTGVTVPISTCNNATKEIVFMVALTAAPAAGDTFKIYPGCTNSPQTCKNVFNNWNRNRATPYIPLKEAII